LVGCSWACGLQLFPKKQVDWLRDRDGIHFGWHGQIYSSAAFWKISESSAASNAWSIELWIDWNETPAWASTIFLLHDPSRSGFDVGAIGY
jgi:hypothetical protein